MNAKTSSTSPKSFKTHVGALQFELQSATFAQSARMACDALIVLVPKTFKAASDALSKRIAKAMQAGDFEAKAGHMLSLYDAPEFVATRAVLVGVGDSNSKEIEKAVAAAVGALKARKLEHISVVLSAALPSGTTEPARALQAAMRACAQASYSYTHTKPSAVARQLRLVTLVVPDATKLRAACAQGAALVAGIEFAKEWANRPANHATPTLLAQAAQSLGKFARTTVQVLGPKEVAKLGMGSFMAVAQGSEQPLRFIVIHYQGAAKTQAPTVLVGKGITFDTGGISIKPAAEMDEMKFDMGGAASVLGTFRALGELQPKLNAIGLIPACENMPDGRAVKPGDVVTSMSGQTIEILNTDAEGRLILCDALTYAERFKPRAVIDIATLTGACIIALGHLRSGLFSTDDDLAQALARAGEAALDPCWRMPLDDDYAEGLKSNFADVANVASRAGGSITAAKFLQRFASKFAWAHLDIAGTAWKSGAAKGATGRPVSLLLNYLLAGVESARAATKSRAK
jgi:leucyl aminopeptidase